MEKISINKWHGVAKVLGCMAGLGGAMVFIFFKGPSLYQGSPNKFSGPSTEGNPKREWVKGSFIMLSSMTCWALWLIMQVSLSLSLSLSLLNELIFFLKNFNLPPQSIE